MKIQVRTLLILGIVICIMIAAMTFLAQFFILSSYQQIEQRESATDVNRVTDQISFETQQLAGSARDWAIWNQSYQFMEDRNPSFIATEIEPDAAYKNLQINGILLYDAAGHPVGAHWYDPRTGTATRVPQSLIVYIDNDRSLLPDGKQEVERSGLIVLPEGPMLVSMHTILPDTGAGPGRGTLIMVRSYGEDRIASLQTRSAVTVHLIPLGEAAPVPGLDLHPPAATGYSAIVSRPQNASIISGYTVLQDISGTPVLLLQVDNTRAMYPHIIATLEFTLISSIAIGIISVLVLALLLRRHIVSPLIELDTSMKKIRETHNLSRPLPVNGDDEIASLNRSFNTLMQDLLDKETALAQRSGELIEANRKANLYLDIYLDVLTYEIMNSTLAIQGFADLIKGGTGDKERIYARRITDIIIRDREIIRNIETISRIFKHPPAKGPVVLRDAFMQAVEHYPALTIPCDGCDVTVIADEKLPMVFDNLISNCIRFGKPDVRITVSVRDNDDGTVEVSVADNGPGIADKSKPVIFERFLKGTDKRSSYGLGLHIVKLLIEAYGGRVWADDRVAGHPEEGAAIRFTLTKYVPPR